MRELLFLPENLAQPLQWATYSVDGHLTLLESIVSNSFDTLKDLNKRGVTLIIPGEQAPSYRFSMPKVSGQAKQQAIAFALEGVCSQSLDEIYVIPGDYIHGKQSAVIIDKHYLDSVLKLAKDTGLKVVGLHIDYMLLKKPELSSWVASPIGKDILWRTDQDTGGRIEAVLWPFIFSQIFHHNHPHIQTLVWTVQEPEDIPMMLAGDDIKQCTQVIEKVPSWIDPASLQSVPLYSLNLGDNKFRSFFNKRKKNFSLAAWIFLTILILSVISQVAFTAFVDMKSNKEQRLLNRWLIPLGFQGMSLPQIKDKLTNTMSLVEKMQLADTFTYSISAVAALLNPEEKNQLVGMSYSTQSGLMLQFSIADVSLIAKQLSMQMPNYQVSLVTPKKGEASTTAFIAIKKVSA